MQRALLALLVIGFGSWAGLNLRPLLDNLAVRLQLDQTVIVAVVLFWCLVFICSYLVFRVSGRSRRPH
jgi:hypothetical protein